MKIAFAVNLAFPSDAVGAFRIEDTARALAGRHEIVVICREKRGEVEGVKTFETGSAVNFPFRARRILRALRPDKIVVSSPPINSLLLNLFFKNTVSDVRDVQFCVERRLSPFPFYYILTAKLFEKWLIRRAEKVVVVAPFMQEKLPGSVLIPNGTDTRMFAPRKNDLRKKLGFGKKKVAVYTGSVSEYHAPEFLQGVVDCAKDVEFVFVGAGNSLGEIQGKNVHKIGVVPRREVAKYINMADVCISTMDRGYPTTAVKVFDYLACNKPVVVNLEEYRKVFGENVSVETSEEGFAKRVSEIAGKRVCTRTRKFITDNFERARLAEKYELLLAVGEE